MTKVINLAAPMLSREIKAAFPDVDLVELRRGEPIPDDFRGDVLLARPRFVEPVAALARRVEWVHVFGTGIDWLPPEAFDAKNLTCARGGSAVAISEFVLASMLSFEKQLPEVWARPPQETWGWRPELGTLRGRRLGLIGFGGIGREIAVRALPFGMTVRAARRHDGPSPMAGVETVGVERVIEESDHLVLAAPLTSATRHVIRAETLGRVKPGVHLVNIARGGLIDQEALRAALDDGRVARATLDVADPEPLPDDHWMYGHPGVRLTGHISWSSPDGSDPLLQAFLDNLGRYVQGQQLEGLVDRAEKY